MILYLHGFRSSPRSFKAQLMAAHMHAMGRGQDWACPQLPISPTATIVDAQRLLVGIAPEDLTIVGSSLGGYYATYLAERLGCRAVLLNPATRPYLDLHKWLGEHPLWHGGGTVVVEPYHLDELRALEVPAVTRPERYYLVAATGDETLDYRDMLAKYPGAKLTLIEGSDHGISDFPKYLDDVLRFAGIDDSAPAAAV
ncbi:esterase [Pandoraea terrae]|uniref:Esterase n=1 Tax=Pandoraea terrae TaxID=1537710 RepID=A0A5E4YUF2_9BURK|nr:YqiA/YcfP family alpha/beta fold hydrolase [Pandoraea terrae]VVE51543.1 esterase [Pandoraea terrae]